MQEFFIDTLINCNYKNGNYSFIFIAAKFHESNLIPKSGLVKISPILGSFYYQNLYPCYVYVFYKNNLLVRIATRTSHFLNLSKLNFDVYLLGYAGSPDINDYSDSFYIDSSLDLISFQHLQLSKSLLDVDINFLMKTVKYMQVFKFKREFNAYSFS